MAREESNREDLLKETRALVERAELVVPTAAESIVVGFRWDGALSIYFGADPAYHFNARGELRRAYADGRLFKADSGTLVALDRNRTAEEVVLLSHSLSADEQVQFLSDLGRRLEELLAALDGGKAQIVGRVPSESDVISRVTRWLTQRPRTIPVARLPRADGN